ncbi:MAG: lipopolysaccharide biosynthesis protein, partial [Pedobacter sp.]
MRNQPDTFLSQAQLSTGIADDKQSTVFNQLLPGDQVNQEFANLIEMAKMKRVLDQLSYLLIINDISGRTPFREPSSLMNTVNEDARKHALEVYRYKYDHKESLDPNDPDQNGMINLLVSMGYDHQSLSRTVNVFRSGDSDFLVIQAESDSPKLSAFIANNIANEFIKNYSTVVRQNQQKAVDYLNDLLSERTDSLSSRMSALRAYKIRNRVLNLDEQSKQLYNSILEYDAKKQEAVQNTSSYAGALNEIERKFSPDERKYLETTTAKVNRDIVSAKAELSALYDQYMKSDYEERYKTSIDSLQYLLDEQIQKSADQYLLNPLATKQELVAEKIRLEVQLDLSRYSINALENELNRLNNQFDNLVPKEALVQSLEMNVEIATKAYMDILNKFNETNLESAFAVKLNVIQSAGLGNTQPSKKMLLVLISGVVSFGFCLMFLFVLYYLDDTVRTSIELSNKTNLPVLGITNRMSQSHLSLREIWNGSEVSGELMIFKNQLRSLRYEIEKELNGKILVVSSLVPEEGKTFITMNLAAALMVAFKKILIIDGDFINSQISKEYTSELYLENFFNNQVSLKHLEGDSSITIFKNYGADNSLSEIANEERIKNKLDEIKLVYDLILIDTSSSKVSNQAK